MQYALVESQRVEAFSGGRGVCATCSAATIAKCGPRIRHHWAHAGRKQCDPWWENETEWHREWKNQFPENCREISHIAPDGEIHRADIKTPNGIVIEIQHSSMTDKERISREAFYGNLVWVIDGSGFRKNFDIYHVLPDPTSELAKDLVWAKARRGLNGAAAGIFFRLSENLVDDPSLTKATLKGGWTHCIDRIEEEVNHAYSGHHQYDWIRPHKTWLDATCPVYIDFWGEWLVRLEIYDESELPCIYFVSKDKFIADSLSKNNARDIACRILPSNCSA